MRRIPFVLLPALLTLITPSLLRAADDDAPKDPALPLYTEAADIVIGLAEKKAFTSIQMAGGLPVKRAVLRFFHEPRWALAYARAVDDPYFASLAIGMISAQYVATDPDFALQLAVGAQERAMAIKSGPESLHLLFQLNTLFPPDRARTLLAASRRNQFSRSDDAAMVLLAHQTISLDPASAEKLLQEINSDRWLVPRVDEAVRALSLHQAAAKPQWAAEQIKTFYDSDRTWPISDPATESLLLQAALADLPTVWNNIKQSLPEDNQDRARYYVMMALHRAGRHLEALAVMTDFEARLAANAPFAKSVADLYTRAKETWATEAQVAKIASPPPITAEQIDAYLTKPTVDELRLTFAGKALHFRDQKQAAAYIEAALPNARSISGLSGSSEFPESTRLFALGGLAQLAAMLNNPAQAKAIADEITIPEVRAFHLFAAYEIFHPLHPATRDWPVFPHYKPSTFRIGP